MKNTSKFIKISRLLVISLATILLVSGCAQKTKSEKTYSYQEAIAYMSKNGIIQDKQKWQDVLSKTDHGKKIHSVKELDNSVFAGNKHSSAMLSLKSYNHVTYPTTTKYGQLTVINVPTFYSTNAKTTHRYSQRLAHQIGVHAHDRTLILNFANNRGGDPRAMIAGVSALLPNGTLFTEVSKTGTKYNFVKTDRTITDSRYHATTKLPAASHPTASKIYLITNFQTVSAAEFTVIALKKNPKTTIIGYPTGGYTTTNQTIKLKHQNEVANITNGTIISPTALHGQKHFNNEPIKPDIASLYEPIPSFTQKIKNNQRLDPEFVEELQHLVQ